MTDHESNHSQSGNFHDGAGVEEQGEINPRMEPGIKNSSPTDPSEPSVSEELELSNDNTMVYALVEVSKDSERTSKRQKIPLSARDFYQVMQKFIDSKKDKSDRKILRPLKRKYGMECGDSNIKIAKAQKQFINSKLANQNPKPSDKIIITNKHSNHATPPKLKNCDIHRSMHMKDQYKLCNQEKSSDLKVLYNRDNLRKEEIRVVKRDRCISITRGTNTDIVQTPKLLEDILLILHSNLVIDRKETTSKKDFVTGDLSANECDEVNEQSKTRNVPEIQNLLFVPLIVMDKNHDFYKQSNSCDTSMCNEDPKCSDFSQEVKRTCDQFPNSDENHKSFKDLRPGTDSAFHLNVLSQSQLDCLGKKGLSFTNIKRKKSDTEAKHTHVCRGEYFLEEVKTLQLKLSAFIKSLEVDNVVNYQNSAANNNTNDSDSIFGGKKTEERHSSKNSLYMLNSVNPGQEVSVEHTEPYCHDFSVQVVLTEPVSNKTETEPSNTKAEMQKALKTIKPLHDRSVSKIMIKKKSKEGSILIASKSTSFSQVSCEYRVTKSKRTTSLPTLGKREEALDILNFNPLGLKMEEPRYDIDSGLQTGQKESNHSQQKIESEFEEQKERVTDMLYKKNFTVMHERENVVPLNPEKILKTAMCTTSCNKIQNDSIEKTVNGTKVPNKETKKTKESTTPSNCNVSLATSESGNSVMIKNKCDEKPEIVSKTRGSNAESEENEKVSKKANPIKENVSTKKKAMVERTVKPESRSKESKLKKPTTPVRSITKAKVQSSKVQSSSEKVVCKCLKNRKSAENLIMSAKDEAYSEKIKNTLDKRIEVPDTCQKKLEKPDKNIDVQEKVHETEVKTTTGSVCTTERTVGEPTSSMNKELNSYKTGCTKSKVISKVKESLTPNANQTSMGKQPLELKSIWALTKVILYKDGSQSFEVLEASSTPPDYVLNSNKKKDSNINNNSHGSNSTNTNTTNNSSINADSRKSNTGVNNSIKTDSTYITHSEKR